MSKSVKSMKMRRQSAPGGFPPPTMPSTSQPYWPPGMMMMMPPWANQGQGPQSSHHATSSATAASGKRPWDEESSSNSSDTLDEDFQPSQNSKKKVANKNKKQHSGKRGPGRPTKADTVARQNWQEKARLIVAAYPPRYTDLGSIEQDESKECRQCSIYTGKVAIIPCGHGKFCFRCMNSLRDKAVASGKPITCPLPSCSSAIRTWVKLFHHTV